MRRMRRRWRWSMPRSVVRLRQDSQSPRRKGVSHPQRQYGTPAATALLLTHIPSFSMRNRARFAAGAVSKNCRGAPVRMEDCETGGLLQRQEPVASRGHGAKPLTTRYYTLYAGHVGYNGVSSARKPKRSTNHISRGLSETEERVVGCRRRPSRPSAHRRAVAAVSCQR
jgi:hypothetical protein